MFCHMLSAIRFLQDFILIAASRKPSLLISTFAFLLSMSILAEEPQQKRSDVRVLIDVSGSMKKNDPENLRVPALQLITNLMPPDSEAGVWSFGKYVNMLVPHKKVDDAWKDMANKAAPTIKSNAMFTNIGDAMIKASYDWLSKNDEEKRSLILLTDGVVDISKDSFQNAQARVKIIKEVLPQLKNAGVNIHTVALSKDADINLLQRLSKETDGWFNQVEKAEELTPVFLKIFEQATDRDKVPIEGNEFDIDKAIEEFTLLVFTKKDAPQTVLVSPSKQKITSSSKIATVSWFEDVNFDLVTIKTPEPGTWMIQADMDPDNRVMIVSNLKMVTSSLPNNVLANEKLLLKVTLQQDDKIITKSEFLELATISNSILKEEQEKFAVEAMDDGKASDEKDGDGVFTSLLNVGEESGKVDVVINADSPTFKRQKRFQMNVYGSPMDIHPIVSDKPGVTHQLEITPKEEVISTENFTVKAKILTPEGTELELEAEDFGSIRKVIRVPFSEKGGRYTVDFSASGKTITQRDFSVSLPSFIFEQPIIEVKEPVKEPEPPEEIEKPAEPEQEVKTEETSAEETPPEETDEESQPAEGGSNLLLWASLGLVINLVIGAIGYLVWKRSKKSSQSTVEALKRELGAEEDNEESTT
ncbi:MAG: VWA domain-containing protein [Pseudomonadota bacterium]